MSDDPIIAGIKQRQDSGTLDYSEDVIWGVDDLLTSNGMPSLHDWQGLEYHYFTQDVAELIQRWLDAVHADNLPQIVFIERQIDQLIIRAKPRWTRS